MTKVSKDCLKKKAVLCCILTWWSHVPFPVPGKVLQSWFSNKQAKQRESDGGSLGTQRTEVTGQTAKYRKTQNCWDLLLGLKNLNNHSKTLKGWVVYIRINIRNIIPTESGRSVPGRRNISGTIDTWYRLNWSSDRCIIYYKSNSRVMKKKQTKPKKDMKCLAQPPPDNSVPLSLFLRFHSYFLFLLSKFSNSVFTLCCVQITQCESCASLFYCSLETGRNFIARKQVHRFENTEDITEEVGCLLWACFLAELTCFYP